MLRIVEDLAEARRTLLRRRSPESVELPAADRDRIAQVFGEPLSAEGVVARIVGMVRAEGDRALRDLTRRLDGVELEELEVPRSAIEAAYDRITPELVDALHLAAERIRAFHSKQLPRSWLDFEDGGALGQIIRPLERVGIFSPRGAAGYPSTVLMQAIPAKVAGVREVVIAAAPIAAALPSPTTLVAADIAGVDRV